MDLRGLKCEFYANFTLSVKISLNACLTSSKDPVTGILAITPINHHAS